MAGNRVVLDSENSYIENREAGERMKLKVKDGTYVFDVQYEDGKVDELTLHSGAGVNTWPQGRPDDIPMMPKRSGSRMCAANGTEIQNLGRKIVQFRGVKALGGCEACMGDPGSENAGGTISNSSSAGFA